MTQQSMSKKQMVIAEMYAQCKSRGDLAFNNGELRAICSRIGFSNVYDATKIDNSSLLPQVLVDDDLFVVHMGEGNHRFVSDISLGYHSFEEIPDDLRVNWPYRRSVLNNINTSESNVLSVGYNHRIIHDFLYEDITASPKIYGSNRTKTPLEYRIGGYEVNAKNVQLEIDLTAEYLGAVTVFEAKNGAPPDFNIFQLFNPFLYYTKLKDTLEVKIADLNACYLVRRGNRLRLYLYTFADPRDPASIELLRSAEYVLVAR